jgi:hypothetical protein
LVAMAASARRSCTLTGITSYSSLARRSGMSLTRFGGWSCANASSSARRDIDRGIPASNHILPAEMSPLEIEQLRWALKMVPLIANLLGDPLSAV